MSKLSEAVKEIATNEIKISKLTWQDYASKIAKAVLDLEFTFQEVDGKVIISPKVEANGYVFAVIVNFKSRTTPYDIIAYHKESDFIAVLAGKEPNATFTTANLSSGDEEVDIGELKTYIEANLKKPEVKIEKAKVKEQLHKEIDDGYKNDGRAKLGGETLENDIAFNEYLHRKFGKLV